MKDQIYKKLNNDHGFGLLQALILIGIISASTGFLVERSGIIGKTIRGSLYKQELYMSTDRIRDILTDSEVCTSLFGSNQLGTSFNRLEHPRFGVIMAKGAEVGSTGSFEITSIQLRRISGGFAELVYTANIKEKFKSNVFLPIQIEQRIPIFAHIAGTTVQSCYYDPQDPDPYDDVAEGITSQAIKKACHSEGAIGATVDPISMKCHIPGIKTLPSIAQQNFVYKGASFQTNEEGKQELALVPMANQYWLPGKSCSGGLLVGINPGGGVICRPLSLNDLTPVMDTGTTTCSGRGASFKLKSSKVGIGCI